MSSIAGLGRSPGEAIGNPLQYSCLENPTGRGAWQATVHGIAKRQTQLSDQTPPELIYNVDLGIQLRDSVIYISILFQAVFPYRLL